MSGGLRALGRGLGVAAHLGVGLGMALAVAFDPSGRLDRQRLAGWWHHRLLQILHVRIVVHGTPLAVGHLSVANHISWLDIPVLAALTPTRFIAKSEIRDWPVAGWLATASGALYLKRGKYSARPLLERLLPLLHEGASITLFPEGTTTDGQQVRTFHARLFAAAIEASCPVQPVALHYAATPDGRRIAPFVGDDDLLRHLLRVLREPQHQVTVHYGDALAPQTDRSQLALQAQQAVEAMLGLASTPANSAESARLPRVARREAALSGTRRRRYG